MTQEVPLVPAAAAQLLYVDTAAFAELGMPFGRHGSLGPEAERAVLSVVAVRPVLADETPTIVAYATRYRDLRDPHEAGAVLGDGRAGIIGRPLAIEVATRSHRRAHRLLNLRIKGIPTGLSPVGVPEGDGHGDGRLGDRFAVSDSLQAAFLHRNGIRVNRALCAACTSEEYSYYLDVNGHRVPFHDRVGFQLLAGAFDRVAHATFLEGDPDRMREFLDDVNYQLCSELGRKRPLSHAGLLTMLIDRKAREVADMYWVRALHGSTTYDNIGLLEGIDHGLVATVDRAHPTYRPVRGLSPGFAREGPLVLGRIYAGQLTRAFWRTATCEEWVALAQMHVERLVRHCYDAHMTARAVEHLGLPIDTVRFVTKHHRDLAHAFGTTVRQVGEEQQPGLTHEMAPSRDEVKDPARYDIFAGLSVLAEAAMAPISEADREARVVEALDSLAPDDARDRRAAAALLAVTTPLLGACFKGLNPGARQEAVCIVAEEARYQNRPVPAFAYSTVRDWCSDRLGKLRRGEVSLTRFRADIEAMMRDNVRCGPSTPRAIASRIRYGTLPRTGAGRLELSRIEENGVLIQELSDGASDLLRVAIADDPLGLGECSRYRMEYALSDGSAAVAEPTWTADGEAVFDVPVRESPERIRVAFFDVENPMRRWDQDGLGFGVGHAPLLGAALVDAELGAFAKRNAMRRRRTSEVRVRAVQLHVPEAVARRTTRLESLEASPEARSLVERLALEEAAGSRRTGNPYRLANGAIALWVSSSDNDSAALVAGGARAKTFKVPAELRESYEQFCLELGVPTSEVQRCSESSMTQQFERGTLAWSAERGVRRAMRRSQAPSVD